MPAVTLGPSGEDKSARPAPGLRRRSLGRALGLLLRIAAPVVGVSALVGAAGCDSTQFVLFTLQNLPGSGSVSVRTSYALDTSPGKNGIARVVSPANQFAIMFPSDTRGTLSASVRAYTQVSPTECYRSDADASLMLNGSHKQELVASLSNGTPAPCDATDAPVTFPPTDSAPLASWGSDAKNIWVVGDKGMILHWDGSAFTQVALAPDLMAAPPTWRAVSGQGSAVWVVGDQGIVARLSGNQFVRVNLTTPMGDPLGSTDIPSWVSVSVAAATTDPLADSVFLVSSNGYIGNKVSGADGVQTVKSPVTFAIYRATGDAVNAPMSGTVSFSDVYCIANNECWFVGYDPQSFAKSGQVGAGAIFQVYVYTNQTVVYSDYSMNAATPTMPLVRSRLRGVWGPPLSTATVRQLYAVGENAVTLFTNNSAPVVNLFDPSTYPKFQTDYSALAIAALAGKSQMLNAIGGTSPTDLWIAGDAGVMLRWAPMSAMSSNPFTLVNTGVTANLGTVFTTGANGRVYASGDHQTFISF